MFKAIGNEIKLNNLINAQQLLKQFSTKKKSSWKNLKM